MTPAEAMKKIQAEAAAVPMLGAHMPEEAARKFAADLASDPFVISADFNPETGCVDIVVRPPHLLDVELKISM